ncbi:hypothetical protein ES319_D07G021100v1 [Gossypium barbadense]|uniref:Late embryogenesis abundant protein LEA-2 subgroup domain-containing protein n=1 Tax=Gossypium barbadense TaxID=3634 RepID=A0A5J5QMQ8_GOSBA|nr:hypothetical protein ES319_D07G021100v1 [Gossypium barbadense]
MSVFPSSKPAATTTAAPPPANGATAGPPAATTTATNGGATKSNLYNPTSRQPYRQPYNRRHHHRPRRNYCCCCCFWTILIILILALLVAIAGSILYVLYRPHRPSFTLASLRVHRLNLTTTADSASSHLSTLFNLTLSSKNPNSHLTFTYDPFTLSCVTSNNDVFIGNGTLRAFISNSKNETTFKGVVITTSSDLDADTVNNLRPDLKKKNGIPLKIEMDTKVTVKVDGLKSKKVGIRVTCDDIKGTVPKGQKMRVVNVTYDVINNGSQVHPMMAKESKFKCTWFLCLIGLLIQGQLEFCQIFFPFLFKHFIYLSKFYTRSL